MRLHTTSQPHLSNSGTALIPSLLIIGMVAAVVVLFFNLVTTQTQNAASQVAANDLTTLRDTAINSAIGQLRQGSTEDGALWISQPGALRTFDADSGTPNFVYKLYSAKDMTVSAAMLGSNLQKNLENDVPGDWNDQPAIYGDLNEPTFDVATKKLAFPIIDPRVQDSSAPTYPTSTTPEGFRYSATTAAGGVSVAGVVLPPSSGGSPNQRLPMPVRWVYLLQDGSMGVMDGDGTPTFVPFVGNTDASATNPIVGRMAWWTDDETSKINVNTASEALFWDTPRCVTEQEVAFAQAPPVRNEVQRFGGHPATTCLSTVFFPGQRLIPGVADNATKLIQIYDLVPRVHYRATTSKTIGAPAGLLGNNQTAVAFDTDRLYASIDELLLDSPAGGGASSQRQTQDIFDGDIDRLKRLRFFLTAESRAPETTASGTPRVSLWPVHYDFSIAGRRTSFDNVSAFCSTLGTIVDGETIQPFHFRRSSSLTNEGEFSNESVDFSVQTSEDPWKIGSKSNGNLATYVLQQAMAKRSGYSKSISEKYDDIYPGKLHNSGTTIQGIMEYIRQTNLMDTTIATNGKPVARYATNSAFIGSDIQGQVTAIQVVRLPETFDSPDVLRRPEVTTTGTAREFTLSEFGLVFSVAASFENGNVRPDGTIENFVGHNKELCEALKLPRRFKAIQITPVFEAFCPGQGFSMIAPSSATQCTNLERLRLDSYQSIAITPVAPTLGAALKPGGEIIDEITYQQDRTEARFRQYGSIGVSVAHLAYLAGGNPPSTTAAKQSKGTWWTGWGGSGGRWMWNDNNSTNDGSIPSMPDFEGNKNRFSKDLPNQYSRGYFLVSTRDVEMRLTYDNSADSNTADDPYTVGARPSNVENTLEIRIGNQRNGDFSGRRFYVKIPDGGIRVPVPGAPARLAMTMGKRLKAAENTASSGNRYLNPTTTGGFGGGTVVNPNSVETIDANDVVRTWVTRHGDYRLNYIRLSENPTLPENERLFVPHPRWDPAENDYTALADSGNPRYLRKIHSFTKPGGEWEAGSTEPERPLVTDEDYTDKNRPDFVISPASSTFSANLRSDYPYPVDPNLTRDWDNGAGIIPDGAYWNKPDDIAKQYDGSTPPYFQSKNWDGMPDNAVNETTAPNQLIPSPVMFGSIPSAASTGLQWTTLLFRPDITDGGHLGSKGNSISGSMAGAPPDHTLLDWFWMPVVQPYAISEPFSTAGKINMNYRIAPFSYIQRATALHAVLKSEQILAIPNGVSDVYKTYSPANAGNNGSTTTGNKKGWRHFIDAETTLLQWEDRFDNGQFFMSAGEVCEQFLVPQGATSQSTGSAVRADMRNFWNNHRLTGDNTLERPYANIYPRLTTRSNTYRVHFKVQTVTKARSTAPNTFDPALDNITGETQGDAVVERSVDPNDPAFDENPQFNYIKQAIDDNFETVQSLDKLYSWRIRHIRRFTR